MWGGEAPPTHCPDLSGHWPSHLRYRFWFSPWGFGFVMGLEPWRPVQRQSCQTPGNQTLRPCLCCFEKSEVWARGVHVNNKESSDQTSAQQYLFNRGERKTPPGEGLTKLMFCPGKWNWHGQYQHPENIDLVSLPARAGPAECEVAVMRLTIGALRASGHNKSNFVCHNQNVAIRLNRYNQFQTVWVPSEGELSTQYR